MAFKKAPDISAVPDSPEKLLLDLPRRKIPNVLPHQGEIMRSYASKALQERDVALQLPTGSGKTLVGLLIGEWRRRKYQEKIVYLCPTKQLVHQVGEQAEEKYGLFVVQFTGAIKTYDQSAKSDYRTGSKIAITTYSSLFNTNPFFNDADVVVVDDAHAAENYIAALWSLRIEQGNQKHQALHAALCNVLRPRIDSTTYARLTGQLSDTAAHDWMNKLPTPIFADLVPQIVPLFETHAEAAELQHPWKMMAERLPACHCYLSPREIFIRPLIPPTWAHSPFESPRQRIFMSATLGSGGDLERLTGRKKITRISTPDGWDRQGVGRRFFIFPSMSLKEREEGDLACELMRRAGRSLVLTPSDRVQEKVATRVRSDLQYPVFTADDIETSKKAFVATPKAVAVVANRYDGIDFPGDECRLLFVEGFPRAMNLQEKFLMSKMAASLLFNDRIQTRVLQAIGRCTRSLEDYSAVVVGGEELPDYLADVRRLRFLHPELQAEIRFGIDQSRNLSPAEFVENFTLFLNNGPEWEEVNQQIVRDRNHATQERFPAMDELGSVVGDEVEYQQFMWQGDYAAAFESATKVLGGLSHPELRGYRALWHYTAGSAAALASRDGQMEFSAKAKEQFRAAKAAAPAIPWLVRLSGSDGVPLGEDKFDPELMEQLERVETVLSKLGTLHDREFAKQEAIVLNGLASKEKNEFEQAHRILGELLGFSAGKIEADGSPDPWWVSANHTFVFEDHAGAEVDSALDVSKARQVFTHPNWVKENVPESSGTQIIPVLVTPVSKVKEGAAPHLEGVALWRLNDFRKWATEALATLRQLRNSFVEPGNLVWRAEAASAFTRQGLDAMGLAKKLGESKARELLRVV